MLWRKYRHEVPEQDDPRNVEQRAGVMPKNESLPESHASQNIQGAQFGKRANPHFADAIFASNPRQRNLCQKIIRDFIVRAADNVKGNLPPQNLCRLICGSVIA